MTILDRSPHVRSPLPFRRISNRILKDVVTFIQRTDGTSRTVLEMEIAPGGGNPLHIHDAYDEIFTCLSGVLGLQVGKDTLHLRPGECVTVPIGVPHRWFNNTPEPTTCRVEFDPGHAGMERGLLLLYGLANDGFVNQGGVLKNPLHLAVILVMTDMRGVGVLGLLHPVLRGLAKLARHLGIERTLITRYDP